MMRHSLSHNRFADKVLTGRCGRAAQMNAGAAAAEGDVLLFLHADSRLPIEGAAAIVDELPRSRRRWGRFDVAIAGRPHLLRLVARLMNIRSRLTGIATGDQGIFVERRLFAAVRGFPEQPLMEDIALSRLLKRVAGKPLCLHQQVVTSVAAGKPTASGARSRYVAACVSITGAASIQHLLPMCMRDCDAMLRTKQHRCRRCRFLPRRR
jgi:hypothetical protein